jgi:excisionase family DNA binding protein
MNGTMPVEETKDGRMVGEPQYVTTEEAAEWLGLTEGRVKQLIAEKKLIGHKPEGQRGWHIETESIRRYDEYRKAIEAAKQILKGGSDD